MLDILLEEADVVKALASDNKPEVMEGYVAEKLRINPPIQGVCREAKVNDTVGSTSLNPGDSNVRYSIFCLDNDFYDPLGPRV